MIRLATPADAPAVRRLSEQVFSTFGDYGDYLPGYLDDPWVTTALDVAGDTVRGFVMVGLGRSRGERGGLVADILAIAVAPEDQGHGIGARLMGEALEIAAGLHERFGVNDVELSVADTNTAAARFFARNGFFVIDAAEGHYPAGQTAVRMARSIR